MPGYSPGMMARFKLAGMPLWKINGIKWAGLFTIIALMSVPTMPLIGVPEALAVSVFASAFGLLTGRLFKNEGACGLFIFFSALIMYFASGGIVPFVFLPLVLLPMRWLSVNYWAAIGNIATTLIMGMILWLLFSFVSGLKMRAR